MISPVLVLVVDVQSTMMLGTTVQGGKEEEMNAILVDVS